MFKYQWEQVMKEILLDSPPAELEVNIKYGPEAGNAELNQFLCASHYRKNIVEPHAYLKREGIEDHSTIEAKDLANSKIRCEHCVNERVGKARKEGRID